MGYRVFVVLAAVAWYLFVRWVLIRSVCGSGEPDLEDHVYGTVLGIPIAVIFGLIAVAFVEAMGPVPHWVLTGTWEWIGW